MNSCGPYLLNVDYRQDNSCPEEVMHMQVHSELRVILISLLGLMTWPVKGEAGYDYDSRRVYDMCSPDQIETIDGVKIEWGHYRQWNSVNGTLSGPGSFVAAPWNTCIADPAGAGAVHQSIADHCRQATEGVAVQRRLEPDLH
jgi:hypothetical protein